MFLLRIFVFGSLTLFTGHITIIIANFIKNIKCLVLELFGTRNVVLRFDINVSIERKYVPSETELLAIMYCDV